MRKGILAILCIVGMLCVTQSVSANELLINGGFETGDFTGWDTLTWRTGGPYGYIDVESDGTTRTGLPTVGPMPGGTNYAITDQAGADATLLAQTLTVDPTATQVLLSFDMFLNDQSGQGPVGTGFNPVSEGIKQFASVDILTLAEYNADPWSTTVVRNIFSGVAGGPGPNPYINYALDITGDVGGGGDYVLRFAQSNTINRLNMGVDNVSIADDLGGVVPEPATMLLMGFGLIGLAGVGRRSRI